MSLSSEIFRKGEASGKLFHPVISYPSRMLRPSADCSDSYHKYVLVWRITSTPYDLLVLSNVISSSNTAFQRHSWISQWQPNQQRSVRRGTLRSINGEKSHCKIRTIVEKSLPFTRKSFCVTRNGLTNSLELVKQKQIRWAN